VEKVSDHTYSVSVKESPLEGRANIAILKALAKYFHIPIAQLRIAAGRRSKKKVIEIP